MKAVNTINGVLRRIELYIGAFIMVLIFGLTTLNIILRYIFNSPLIWADEVIRFGFVWLGYLSVCFTLSYDNHVRFTMSLDALHGKVKTVVYIFLDVLIAAVILILFPSMLKCFGFLVKTPALMISERYFFVIVPVGYSLIIIHSLLNVFKRLQPESFNNALPYREDAVSEYLTPAKGGKA